MKRWGWISDLQDPVRLVSTDWRIAIGLGAAFIMLAAVSTLVATACGSFHDDAIYVSTAKALAEGRGYDLINLPGAPPQTKYPILYPLLLAFVWKLWPTFPANLWAMQAVTLLTAGVAIGASYLYLVRFGYGSRRLALGMLAIAVTTPFLLFISTRTLSEMPFALLIVLALWRVESEMRRPPGSRASQFVTGIVIALPYLCRSIGIVLVIAVLLVLVVRRRALLFTLLGIAVAAGPWVYWSLTALGHWQQDNIVGYYTDYLGSWAVFASDPAEVIEWNLIYLFLATLATSLIGPYMGASSYLGWKLAPVFLLIGSFPWIVVVRRALRFNLLAVFLAGYGGLLLLWPWPPARFLLPVLPFILLYAGHAAVWITRSLLPTLHPWALRTALGITLVANLVVIGRYGLLVRDTGFPFPVFPERTVSWSSYEEVFSWLRQHSAPTDRVASALDSMVFLYTDRQAIRPFRHNPERLFYKASGPKSGTAVEVFGTLTANGAKYLTMFPIPGFEAEMSFGEVVAELRRLYPERVVPRFVARDPRFMVFEIR